MAQVGHKGKLAGFKESNPYQPILQTPRLQGGDLHPHGPSWEQRKGCAGCPEGVGDMGTGDSRQLAPLGEGRSCQRMLLEPGEPRGSVLTVASSPAQWLITRWPPGCLFAHLVTL